MADTCITLAIFKSFTENEIDGSTLIDLTKDLDEFKTVLPKSGHRLKIKKVLYEAKDEETQAITPANPIAISLTETTEDSPEKDLVRFKHISVLLTFESFMEV